MAFIIKPLVTEKMTNITDKSSVEKTVKVKGEPRKKPALVKYGFIVKPEANKLEIKKEVESLYNVTVLDVNTARYAGIRVNRAYVRTIVISGAICGLAGFVAVSGASHSISIGTAGGRGFTAIIVAWLAQFNSVVMVIFSFLLVFLQKGAQAIASTYNLSKEVSEIITGIILFFLLGSEFFVNYTVHFRGKKVEKK